MEIKIYVANLAKYNEGILKGQWITLPVSENELNEELENILGNDEEYAIHDYEAPFKISEYTNINELNELAEQIENLSEYEQLTIEMLLKTGEFNIIEALEKLENNEFTIFTECYDMEDVAQSWIHDHIGSIQDAVKNIDYYIDEKAVKRDLEISGYFTEIEEENEEELSESEKNDIVEEVIENGGIDRENYFDYAAYGRDLEIEGSFYYIGNGVYVELH